MISSHALQACGTRAPLYRCQNTNRTAICITLGVRVVITWPNRVFTLTSNPFHQPALLQTIGQSAGAMVANEEPVGQRAYGRPVGIIGRADGQQELVLLRLQPLDLRGLFAEIEKAANLVAKTPQRSIIGGR